MSNINDMNNFEYDSMYELKYVITSYKLLKNADILYTLVPLVSSIF